MKRLLFILMIMIPVLSAAQGHKGSVESCAPMKKGKVYYSDEVEMKGMSKLALYTSIHKWAKKNYGKDVFLSNVSASKSKGTISVNSKVELLLNDTEKTIVKYKMKIVCRDGEYAIEMTDITYQYDPKNEKQYKTYSAESVIANNGKSNTVAIIKNPKLFCDATFFFAENLFANVFDAAQED